MNRLEDKIRDYLADNLNLLEDGLTFFEKELRLPNPTGAGGRIDIVAKDRLGQYVVIEIKRSNQAARQALNEIHKYCALFRTNHGLGQDSIRLMVVSTEWHELLLPLQEFSEASDYHVEGIRIDSDESGYVSHAEKLDLERKPTEEEQLSISRKQGVFLFRDESDAVKFIDSLNEKIAAAHIRDYYLIKCDYKGTNKEVIFPHGIYLCFTSPIASLSEEEFEAIKTEIDWEDGLDYPEENFFTYFKLGESLHCDDFEIGYPEKLTNISHKWAVEVCHRAGRFGSKGSLFSDEELIKKAQSVEGGSNIYYCKMSSPKFKSAWKTFRSDITPVFLDYEKWGATIEAILDQIEMTTPRATVGVGIYCPGNFLISLYAMSVRKDMARLPHFEIVIEDVESAEVRIINGIFTWNGKGVKEKPTKIVNRIFNDEFEWISATHFGAVHEYEAKIVSAHNLKMRVIETTAAKGKFSSSRFLDLKNSSLKYASTKKSKNYSIYDFMENHEAYLYQLEDLLNQNSSGLREQVL